MSTRVFHLDSGGTLERAQAELAQMPRAVDRAMARAYRKLGTWMQRQILRAVSGVTKIPQARFQAMMRLYQKPLGPKGRDGVEFWVGTNPIKVHRLGPVTWTPYRGQGSRPKSRPHSPARAKGARVGRETYAGTFSWGPGSRTGSAVLYRAGAARLPIETETIDVHWPATGALSRLMPEAEKRFETLLRQELNYALNIERKRAA